MAIEQIFNEIMAARSDILTALETARALREGDGGGRSGGLEARVAKLEAHMDHLIADSAALKTDTAKLKVDVATLVERVGHLPSKGFIVSAVLGAGALVAALNLLGPNLRGLLGLH